MPLFLTKYNPFFADPDKPTLDSDFCENPYCHLMQNGDIVHHQYYQTPCGLNDMCDIAFSEYTVGADLVTNGTFTGNANSWTVNGVGVNSTACPATVDGWCYNTNKVGHDGTLGNFDALAQAIAALTPGTFYELTYTVSGRTSGTIQALLGDGAGATQGAENDTNDTFTEILYFNDTDDILQFVPSATFDGNIDDVTLKAVTYSCWDVPGVWALDGLSGTACKVGSGAGDLEESVAAYTTVDGYYQLSFRITVLQGSIQAFVANTADQDATIIESSGDYTLYFETTLAGVVKFTPSSDFLGCISFPADLAYPGLFELRRDYDFIIKNDSQELVIPEEYIEYWHEYITLKYDPQDDELPYGCWYFEVFDACDGQYGELVTNGNLTGGGPGLNPAPGWVALQTTGDIDWSGNQYEGIVLVTSASPVMWNVNPIILDAANYEFQFEIMSIDPGIKVRATFDNGVYATTALTTAGVHSLLIPNYNPDAYVDGRLRIFVSWDGGATPGSAVIDNITGFRNEPFEATYTSECVRYEISFPNTKLIQGYSDAANLGFEFVNTGFRLKQRIQVRAFGTQYPTDDEEYTYSTGTRQRHYAKTEKIWGVYTDPLNETAHDTLRLQTLLDHFIIGNIESDDTEYFALSEYTPEWAANGSYSVAPVRFEARIKAAGTKFLRNC